MYLVHTNKYRELGKMRQQRYIFQTKEKDKTPEREQSEMEITNLPEKEFNIMIIKTLNKLRRKHEHGKKFISFTNHKSKEQFLSKALRVREISISSGEKEFAPESTKGQNPALTS